MSRKRPRLSDDSLHPLSRQHRNAVLSEAYASFSPVPRILHSHTSCVNALEFSVDGMYMGSGGDDLRVALWKGDRVVGNYLGHEANIFSIGFMGTAAGELGKMVSGGMDEKVYVHDLEYGEGKAKTPVTIYGDHEVRFCPFFSQLRSTTTDNDLRVVYDVYRRTRHRPTSSSPPQKMVPSGNSTRELLPPSDCWMATSARSTTSFTIRRVRIFLSRRTETARIICTTRGNRLLIRLKGGPPRIYLFSKFVVPLHYAVPMLTRLAQYATILITPGKDDDPGVIGRLPGDGTMLYKESEPDTSSLAFDSTGKLLCATVSRYLPVLYEMNNSTPLATFDHQSSTGASYSNLCTVKVRLLIPIVGKMSNRNPRQNGSFGGSGDNLYYAAGSDDFAAYVWKVPPLESLKERGRNLTGAESESEWVNPSSAVPLIGRSSSCDTVLRADGIATGFRDENEYEIIVPPTITSPQRLYQHRSIVNTALFHPTLPLLYTCGIEKVIRVHSSIPPPSSASTVVDWIPRTKDQWDTRDDAEEQEDSYGMFPSESTPAATTFEEPWRAVSARRENLRTLEIFDSYLEDDVEPLWGAKDSDDSESSGDLDAVLYEGREYDDLERLARDFPEYDSDDPGAGGRGDDGDRNEGMGEEDWEDDEDSGVDQDDYP